jgi:hypothetical protein
MLGRRYIKSLLTFEDLQSPVEPNQDETKVASAARETRLDATRRTRDLAFPLHPTCKSTPP